MDEDALHQAEKGQPTIDRIEVVEFQSHEAAQERFKIVALIEFWNHIRFCVLRSNALSTGLGSSVDVTEAGR
jgi:hypothetical protein